MLVRSSSTAIPPMNPQLQLDLTNTTPSNPGNSGHTRPKNPQNCMETVTFRQVLRHWCGLGTNGHHNNITSSTLFHIWFSRNVYPLVTPERVIYFTLSQISFFLAYGFFTQTGLYKSYIIGGEDQDHSSVLNKARPLIFLAAAFGAHTVSLIFLLFFSFCSVAFERYRYYHLLKSLGEYLVMLLVPLLIMGIGDQRLVGHTPSRIDSLNVNVAKVDYSKVAGLVTCGLLTVDALCIVNLLDPGHHYALLEATATLTLHLGLAGTIYLRIPAAAFVLVIVVVKNFLWRHICHAQPPTNQIHPVALAAPEVV